MSESRRFDGGPDDIEWQAQERALREASLGLQRSGDARYDRLLARALREPPFDPIPADFAARTAALAERGVKLADGTEAAGDRLEAWLQVGLVALLTCVGSATVVVLGLPAVRALTAGLPAPSQGPATRWAVVIFACWLLSSVIELWSRRTKPELGTVQRGPSAH